MKATYVMPELSSMVPSEREVVYWISSRSPYLAPYPHTSGTDTFFTLST